MRPARFVTLCFLYCGALLLIQYALVNQLRFDPASIVNLGVALTILFTGLYRLRNPVKEEQRPREFGFLTHGMALLALVLTVILAAQLFVLQ